MNRAAIASDRRASNRARLRGAALAGVAALALAGCNGNSQSPVAKAMKPLSPEMVSLIEKKEMTPESPVAVRIFKEESELEVWKETKDGDYALLKTYPICRWSGELGPKVREGDRQAPEGFYTITPGQMNPNSSYYLSFNMGYPNAYDAAWGRTGAHLMVHGDCSSAGCYAMTDEQIQEIFALGRDSFQGGQRSFQVQAYPFRMTPVNMARHRSNPNMPFWRMIKEGYDSFEVAKRPPKVDVCDKRYIFNATPNDPSQRFRPTEACPAYTVPSDIEQAVAARRAADDAQIASLAPRTPLAPVRTGTDGGMNKVFLAQIENPERFSRAPGTIPDHVNPPSPPIAADQPPPVTAPPPAAAPAPAPVVAALAPAPAPTAVEPADEVASGIPMPMPRPTDAPGGPRPADTVALAAAALVPVAASGRAASTDQGSGGFLDGMARLFGTNAPASTGSVGPAPARPSDTSSSGGFLAALSLDKLFGKNEPAPSGAPAATAPYAGLPDAAVPLPPQRPSAPPPTAFAPASGPAAAVPAVAPAVPASKPPTAAAPAPASRATVAVATEPLPGAPILPPAGFAATQ